MLKKNDIKYIIKRVIIILITGFVFFNISKCNAYALSTDYYIKANDTNINPTFLTSVPDSSYFVNSYNVSNINFHFYYYYSSGVFDEVLFFIFDYNNKYYLFANYYKKTDTDLSNLSYYKVISDSNSLSYPPNIYFYDNNDNVIGNLSTSSSLNGSLYYGNSFEYSYYEIDLENVSLTRKNDSNLAFNILENGSIVYSNGVVPLKVNNITHDFPSSIIPNNYSKIDLTGYQAVLIIPQNYQTMLENSSHTDEIIPGTFNTYLDFNYYSQFCTRPILINITNTKDVILNENAAFLLGVSAITGTCPTEPTLNTLSYQYDMHTGYKPNALLIYNTQINNEDNWNNNSTYNTSYVWYNSSLYNYQLISDLSSFNADINYIDYYGDQKQLIVEQLPSLDDSFQYAIDKYQTEQTTSLEDDKLQNYLNFLKMPFTFLSNLNTNSCTPLELPFPHSDLNISIPCMSTIYENHLPMPLISILKAIINGLLIYRITLSNIIVIHDILDPSDDKLEVLDL